jgi:hypothetical protein
MRTSTKILGGIVVLLLLLVIVGSAMSSNNSPTPTPSATATPAPTATPNPSVVASQDAAQVRANQAAGRAAQANPTPAPTATPAATTPSTPDKLTQAQLDAGEAALVSDGYTFTQHLTYDHTNADGTLVYMGKATTPEGYSENIQLMVYKDQASADAGLASSVTILQGMGFTGSYSDAYAWTGTMIYQGQAVGGGAVESSAGAPYMVTVFFLA